MSSDTIDRILRYGAGAEFAELYHEIGRHRYALRPLPLSIIRAFDACEDTVRNFEAEIERFKEEPINPLDEKGGASPDASTKQKKSL